MVDADGQPQRAELLSSQGRAKAQVITAIPRDDFTAKVPILAIVGPAASQPVNHTAITFVLQTPLKPTNLPNATLEQP